MWWRIAVTALVWGGLEAAAVPANAEDVQPKPHRLPFQPIINGHDVQPRRDQLDQLHMSDLTPPELQTVERLYWELERRDEPVVEKNHRGRRVERHSALGLRKTHRSHRFR